MISGYTRDVDLRKQLRCLANGSRRNATRFICYYNCASCLCVSFCIEHGKSVHEYASRNGLESNLFVANALMDMYAKCGNMEDARSVFDRTNQQGHCLVEYIDCRLFKELFPDEALVLFGEMQCKMKPNCVTMACILLPVVVFHR
ncbi:putative tetratricopeptide-like helical domain superfamily [Dioscorea sansibarensis]